MIPCSCYRWLLLLMPSVPVLGKLARRHKAQCPACQADHADLEALEHRLRLDPEPNAIPIPNSLQQRFEIALAHAAPPRATVRHLGPRVWVPTAAATAACAWVFLMSRQPAAPPATEPRIANLEASLVQPVRELRAAVSLPRLADAVEQPLNGELEASLDQGRDLLAGMLRSALPEAEADAVLDHAERWLASNR